MLAEVVVFGNVQRNAGIGRSQKHAAEGEAGNVLQNVGMLDGFSGSFAPDKWGVAGYQDSGNGEGVKALRAEEADDDRAGSADIVLGDLFGGEGSVTGTGPWK